MPLKSQYIPYALSLLLGGSHVSIKILFWADEADIFIFFSDSCKILSKEHPSLCGRAEDFLSWSKTSLSLIKCP